MTRSAAAFGALVAACLGCQSPGLEPPSDNLDAFLTAARGTAPAEGTITYSNASCTAPEWTALHPEEPTLDWPTFALATIPDLSRSHASLDLTATDPVVIVREPNFTEGIETEGPFILAVTTWSGSDDVECDDATIFGLHVVRTIFYGLGVVDSTLDEAFDAATAQADDIGIDPIGDDDVAIAR